MASTQLFSHTTEGLAQYKQSIHQALDICQELFLLPQENIDFFRTYTDQQEKYIPRDDVDHFLMNVQFLQENKEAREDVKTKIQNISLTGNQVQQAFEYISTIHDAVAAFREQAHQRQAQQAKKAEQQALREQEQQEKEAELAKLEQMLED